MSIVIEATALVLSGDLDEIKEKNDMAKGIVVVDDIPVICAECDFAHLTQNKQYFHCDVKNKTVYNAEPDWCPIQEMPKRRTGYLIDTERHKDNYKHGWNDCLSKIEGKM